MEMKTTGLPAVTVPVQDSSQVGTVRRMAVGAAERLGFSETRVGNVAIVVTELATNLVRHAGGGQVVLQSDAARDGRLDILAIDRGPGIGNVEEAMRDGFSTSGTPGGGLGALSRLADSCDIFSAPGTGTIVLATFGSPPAAPDGAAMLVGGISLPHPSETVSGDAWAASSRPDLVSVLVVDGLGHGQPAAEASREAVRVFRELAGAPAVQVIQAADAALRHTRGAAIGIAEIRPSEKTLTFVGVGNIGGTLVRGSETRSVVSHAGIVGHQVRKIQEFTYPWAPGTTLILYSDGLQSHWQLGRYPGIAGRHPTVLSAALYRDHARGRDDVTVVAVRDVA